MSQSNKEEEKKGIILKQPKYTIEIKYSDEAIEKKLMRFTSIDGESFEISADEMISILVNQVSTETLTPTFVDMEKINVVQVSRQIKCTADKDIKKGEEFRIEYVHPYPVEFAIVEEAFKIAQIKNTEDFITLTKEFIESVRKEIKPSMGKFVSKFYKGHRQIDLKDK